MRDNVAVLLFIAIILFILVSYIVAALYFDGFLNMLDVIGNGLWQIWELIKLVFEAIYDTFVS